MIILMRPIVGFFEEKNIFILSPGYNFRNFRT